MTIFVFLNNASFFVLLLFPNQLFLENNETKGITSNTAFCYSSFSHFVQLVKLFFSW